MVPEKIRPKQPRLSRRMVIGSALTGGVIALARSLLSRDDFPEPPVVRERSTPKNPHPHHFDHLPEGESVLGKGFTINANDPDASISVTIEAPFDWIINGQHYAVQQILAGNNTIQPDFNIHFLQTSIRDCVSDIIVASNNTGISIETSVGEVFVPSDQIEEIVHTLSNDDSRQAISNIRTDVEVFPNDTGVTALNVDKAFSSVLSWFGSNSKSTELPRFVDIRFVHIPDQSTLVANAN